MGIPGFLCRLLWNPEVRRTGIIADLLELVDLGHRLRIWSTSCPHETALQPKAHAGARPSRAFWMSCPGLDPRPEVEIRQLILELAHGENHFPPISWRMSPRSAPGSALSRQVWVAAGTLEALHLQWTLSAGWRDARRRQEALILLSALPRVSTFRLQRARTMPVRVEALETTAVKMRSE